jgi:hypothetical protein
MTQELNPWRPVRGATAADSYRLAVAQNLARIYAEVLQEPPPPELQRLLNALRLDVERQRTP